MSEILAANVNDIRLASAKGIEEFSAEMFRQMELHRAEKGDWRNLKDADCVDWFGHGQKAISAILRNDTAEARKQCVHAANYLMMLYSILGDKP